MKAPLSFLLTLVALLTLPVFAQEQRRITQPSVVTATRRVALVIGNGAYKVGPLKNPVNDARAMTGALRELGFEVIHREDLKREDMRRAIRDFGKEISRGGVGLFYYAGHGVQVRGENYLIPVDAAPESADEVDDECVNAGYVLDKLESAGNGMNIVILDACRNNPFTRSFRSGSDGLASVNAPTGTLIAYATSPGAVASDGGNSGNGVYTQELLKILKTPGLGIEEVFKRVRIAVRQRTQGRQTPWESSSLVGDFYFAPPNRKAGHEVVATEKPAPLKGGATDSNLSNSPVAEKLYNSARQLEEAGNFAEAAALYREVANLESGKALYHSALGRALWDDYAQKIKAWGGRLSARVALSPRNQTIGEQLMSAASAGNIDITRPAFPYEMIDAFQRAVKLEPDNSDYREDFVNVIKLKYLYPYEVLDKTTFEESEPYVREALHLKPDDSQLHKLLADALGGQGNWADAETEYREALRLDPQSIIMRDELAMALGKQSKWEDAEAEYKEVIRLSPQSKYSHSSFADALSEQGKWADALREYKEALRLAPKGDDDYFRKGLQEKIREMEKRLKNSKR